MKSNRTVVPDDIQFMHFRPMPECLDPLQSNGLTIAIKPTAGKQAIVAFALCSPFDNFNKARGRTIAYGRMRASLAGREKVDKNIRRIDIADEGKFRASVVDALRSELQLLGFSTIMDVIPTAAQPMVLPGI